MSARPTTWLCAGTALTLVGLAAGCTTETTATASGGGATVTVELTDAGCAPSPARVQAGVVAFHITNKGAAGVTEAELKQGETILGEKENLAPGLSGGFTLSLKPGTYTMSCPNASRDSFDLVVGGSAAPASRAPALAAALDQATTGYRQYVIGEVDKLVPATKRFTDAVRAGNIDEAKPLYASARYFYEEVEPVAESFGDLDPQIDARADDVDDPGQWKGFHRIEKALWQDKSLAGMRPIADKLDADVATLRGLVAKASYQPAQLANGATELLNEVGASKVTGEEDRYSHTDLSDFQANVDGAEKIVDLLHPLIGKEDAALTAKIDGNFKTVDTVLAKYKTDDGFQNYDKLSQQDRLALQGPITELAEGARATAYRTA